MLFEIVHSIRPVKLLSAGIVSAAMVSTMILGSQVVLAADGDAAVKKTESGICHDSSSRHFSRVKNFKAYPSMQACLDDGGRKPKR